MKLLRCGRKCSASYGMTLQLQTQKLLLRRSITSLGYKHSMKFSRSTRRFSITDHRWKQFLLWLNVNWSNMYTALQSCTSELGIRHNIAQHCEWCMWRFRNWPIRQKMKILSARKIHRESNFFFERFRSGFSIRWTVGLDGVLSRQAGGLAPHYVTLQSVKINCL